MNATHTCPVCGFEGLDEPARTERSGGSYEICVACGFQFGVSDDDEGYTDEAWRQRWIAGGMPWDSASIRPPPPGWDPVAGLRRLGFAQPPAKGTAPEVGQRVRLMRAWERFGLNTGAAGTVVAIDARGPVFDVVFDDRTEDGPLHLARSEIEPEASDR